MTDSVCSHTNAMPTGNGDEMWCMECGEQFQKAEVIEPAQAETKSKKAKPNRRPKAKLGDRFSSVPFPTGSNSGNGSVPVAKLPEPVASGDQQRKARPVLSSDTRPGVGAPTGSEETAEPTRPQETGIATEVKDYTSVDENLPLGPWHGIPCPNRSHKTDPCNGIMETFRTIENDRIGNSYWMRCPECSVQIILNFQRATIKQ